MNGWKRLWIFISLIWAAIVMTTAFIVLSQSSYNEPTKASVISKLSESSRKFYEIEDGPRYTVTLSHEDGTKVGIQFPLLTEEFNALPFKEKLEKLAKKSGKTISVIEIENFAKEVKILNLQAAEAKREFDGVYENIMKANSDRRSKVIFTALISILMPILIILLLGYGMAWVRAGFTKNA
ncbi:MAG: hypothetical protein EOO52_07035 [Gammaproteobacteria bacterium]|nr:MAG: hypothetical protein EOO52_07035 [Gammaproteobacteria bacterium]